MRKKAAFFLLVLSPILLSLLFFSYYKDNSQKKWDEVSEAYFGERKTNDGIFIRGGVVSINKNDRILTIQLKGDEKRDVVVLKDSDIFFKLSVEKGGGVKQTVGDYFSSIKVGDAVDVQLLENSLFTKKILVYDSENFIY